MSKNIFLDKNQFVPNPKRNAYDKSKNINSTYQAGYIYPIDWEEVTFGDSVKIDISAGLRTMPMVWPIQTPVIAKFYSFYVRYRTLQRNFTDFRFNNKPIVHPFIALNPEADFWKTGQLGDHLGIPTTYASSSDISRVSLVNPVLSDSSPKSFKPFCINYGAYTVPYALSTAATYIPTGEQYGIARLFGAFSKLHVDADVIKVPSAIFDDLTGLTTGKLICAVLFEHPVNGLTVYGHINLTSSLIGIDESGDYYTFKVSLGSIASGSYGYSDPSVDISHGVFGYAKTLMSKFEIDNFYLFFSTSITGAYNSLMTYTTIPNGVKESLSLVSINNDTIHELSDVLNPFSGGSPEIPLSALIPRAYEAIYRSHFEDLINEPFILDGEAQYNRYITNDGDGADTTDYKLFRRNWEADFLTSAKPSPQQGFAPIVGITSAGDITLVKGDGSEYTVHVVTDDNDLPTSIDWASQTSESDVSVRRTLLDLATSGITINALRNTNAFQKWLESNYRRGLKFRDQVLSNFGVKLEYKELDMPEFLGGFSIPLDVNTVNQTSSSVDGSPLGDIAGNGGFYGRAKHSISHYCDEEGVVMTLMCITPIPVYSQLLSRCWLKQTPVDYYNPSFGKIGNQPITYEEVCPVQAYNEGVDVHSVFGYQRPWYHMISSVDEVHGKMRSDMSGFVMQRIFGSTPELGASFLHIDESQMNDVFVTKAGVTDTYYGQIGIKKYKKTCIPRYNLPSLN